MELIKLIQDKNYQVSSILDLGELTNNDAFSLVSHLDSNKYNDINLGSLKTYKASLPLASEIVARSRVDMSLKILYCINSGITIYYMDTDSASREAMSPPSATSRTAATRRRISVMGGVGAHWRGTTR